MTNQSNQLCQQCINVENVLEIDIQRLFHDLARIKGKNLTDTEKHYLCLSLSGYEPIDIARQNFFEMLKYECKRENPNLSEQNINELVDRKIQKKSADIRNYMAKTINSYIIALMMPPNRSLPESNQAEHREPRKSWAKIICFLRENGYKKNLAPTHKSEKILIEVEYEGKTLLKNIFELLRTFEEKFGKNSLNLKEIEQEGGND